MGFPSTFRLRAALILWVCAGSLPAFGAQGTYKTRNVVIAVMDGVSYEQTFGDPLHQLIPHLWNDLRPLGTLYTRFYNNGVTITMAGHSNIMTGTWQYSRNWGPIQTRPSIIHYMADELAIKPTDAWLIFGKGSYAYQPETSFPGYRGFYEPRFVYDVGETTYQQDHDVLTRAVSAMRTDRPVFMLLNFGTTDHTAHSGDWNAHSGAIRNNDEVLFGLWKAIQSDTNYRDRTTLIITNDHGYMDDGTHDGFAEHGDASEGSRHVMLLLLGPDIKPGAVIEAPAYHVDIAPTVGELLGFQTPFSQGEVLKGALVPYLRHNRQELRTDRARKAAVTEALARKNVVQVLADRVLDRYRLNLGDLQPSNDAAILLWGLLSAYDKLADPRYPGFVSDWLEAWRPQRPDSADLAFVEMELCYRDRNRPRAQLLLDHAARIAYAKIEQLEKQPLPAEGNPEFLLPLMLAAGVSERNRDEGLWHRAAELYIQQVRAADDTEASANVTTLRAQEAVPVDETGSGQRVERTGKVLPDVEHKLAGAGEPWYLLAAAAIRSHGLPYKGENLSDVPFFGAEVLYRTALLLEPLSHPGDLWQSPDYSAMAMAGISEARRRITGEGDLYGNVQAVYTTQLTELRPESAEIMPNAEFVRKTIRDRLTATNYNVQYGFPSYEDFDFMRDLLRLRIDEVTDEGSIGALLIALAPATRVKLEPFVPAPRR